MEGLDAIEDLTAALRRAMNIQKYHGAIRAICVDTIKTIDNFGKFDAALNDECPETQRNV